MPDYSFIQHVGEKDWVELDDFVTAFYVALAMFGYRLTAAERDELAAHLRRARYHRRVSARYDDARAELGLAGKITFSFDEVLATGERAEKLARR